MISAEDIATVTQEIIKQVKPGIEALAETVSELSYSYISGLSKTERNVLFSMLSAHIVSDFELHFSFNDLKQQMAVARADAEQGVLEGFV